MRPENLLNPSDQRGFLLDLPFASTTRRRQGKDLRLGRVQMSRELSLLGVGIREGFDHQHAFRPLLELPVTLASLLAGQPMADGDEFLLAIGIEEVHLL